jgi:hypothetical protein
MISLYKKLLIHLLFAILTFSLLVQLAEITKVSSLALLSGFYNKQPDSENVALWGFSNKRKLSPFSTKLFFSPFPLKLSF